jgi:hypothetical protein
MRCAWAELGTAEAGRVGLETAEAGRVSCVRAEAGREVARALSQPAPEDGRRLRGVLLLRPLRSDREPTEAAGSRR